MAQKATEINFKSYAIMAKRLSRKGQPFWALSAVAQIYWLVLQGRRMFP
jgi:hypothetical protein